MKKFLVCVFLVLAAVGYTAGTLYEVGTGSTVDLDNATLSGTLPDGNLADAVVRAASSQTLTNKTIDGDDNTIQDVAGSSLKENTSIDLGTGDVTADDATLDTVITNDVRSDGNMSIDANSASDAVLSVKNDGAGGMTMRCEGDMIVDGTMFIETVLSATGDLIPTIASSFDIGKSTAEWRDGYFSDNVKLGASQTTVLTDGSLDLGDNTLTDAQVGDLTDGTETTLHRHGIESLNIDDDEIKDASIQSLSYSKLTGAPSGATLQSAYNAGNVIDIAAASDEVTIRTYLEADENGLKFDNNEGSRTAIYASNRAYLMQSGTTANHNGIAIDGDGTITYSRGVGGSGDLTISTASNNSNLVLESDNEDVFIKAPTGDSVNLQINDSDVLVVDGSGIEVTGNIITDASGTRDLGTSSLYLDDGYINDMYVTDITIAQKATIDYGEVTNNFSIGGDLDVTGTITGDVVCTSTQCMTLMLPGIFTTSGNGGGDDNGYYIDGLTFEKAVTITKIAYHTMRAPAGAGSTTLRVDNVDSSDPWDVDMADAATYGSENDDSIDFGATEKIRIDCQAVDTTTAMDVQVILYYVDQ